MKIQPKLLAIKNINPLQKLILGLILNESPEVIKLVGGCDKTCGEIGKELGKSRAVIKAEVKELQNMNLITSKKGDGTRCTNVTEKLLELLK